MQGPEVYVWTILWERDWLPTTSYWCFLCIDTERAAM